VFRTTHVPSTSVSVVRPKIGTQSAEKNKLPGGAGAVVQVIKTKRLGWAVHVACMRGEDMFIKF
jgi:hypothetical protein